MDNSIKESLVVFQSAQGLEWRASLSRLTRHQVAFEVYSPNGVLRLSEVLNDFKIVLNDRTLYSGRAVLSNQVNGGLSLVCEATLSEESWTDLELTRDLVGNGWLSHEFSNFIQEWQKLYKVQPEYKVIIADMQSFLMDLRLWLEQVELGVRSMPSGDRLKLEQDATHQIAQPVIPAVDVLFDKFEAIAGELEQEALPAHRSYMRRHLHPWVLTAPFAYRAFNKPLGYAGDYELVNMMARNTPAAAHRNRIHYLFEHLVRETLRANQAGHDARIYNVACGPAQETQQFLQEQALSSGASFTLLDFNEETLRYTESTLNGLKARHSRRTSLEFIKKSVHQLLKDSGRSIARAASSQHDLVYCAGLFDYLPDPVCQRLMNLMYEWLAPGGLLIATNVDPSNPMRHGMEHLLDWHLIYRTGPQLLALKPQAAPADCASVHADETGVNVFLEVRKPAHA